MLFAPLVAVIAGLIVATVVLFLLPRIWRATRGKPDQYFQAFETEDERRERLDALIRKHRAMRFDTWDREFKEDS